MILGRLHPGSGLGDQIFRLITVRTLAQEKGFDYAMIGQFKGDFFLEQPTLVEEFLANNEYEERDLRDANGIDVRSFDPESQFIEDSTVIDGSFEDSKYWGHNLYNINEWLKVEPLEVPEWKCIVGFRGGEYYSDPNLGLTPDYYGETLEQFKGKELEVHTDDPSKAMDFFHHFNGNLSFVSNQAISHSRHSNMAFNWRSARYAKYAVIPNSAFFIIPRLLKHREDPTAITIAPRYWARRNTKGPWRPAAFYKEFQYI